MNNAMQPALTRLFALVATVFLSAPAWADGCAARYSAQKPFPLAEADVGKDALATLRGWGLAPYREGMDRVALVKAPDDTPAMQVTYPKGSKIPYADSDVPGGALFIVTGIPGQLTSACLSYRVYVPDDFDFAHGGELPGLYGGSNNDAKPADHCAVNAGKFGFAMHFLWHEDGAGGFYNYVPIHAEKCGEYKGETDWKLARGQWTQIEQEIILNHEGQRDGAWRAWANGKPVMDKNGMTLRLRRDVFIDGISFTSYFDGKGNEAVSPKNQSLLFAAPTLYYQK